MSKNEIKREDLKFNFLKQTIIRLDYDILFDKNLEKFIEDIYPILIEKGYKIDSNQLVDIEDRVDEVNSISHKVNTVVERLTSFQNDEKNIRIEIAKTYFTITMDYHKYENFEQFGEIFNKMVEKLKEIRSGFYFRRIGVRKINIMYFNSIENLNNYVEPNVLQITKSINETKNELILKDSFEAMFYNTEKVNRKVSVYNVNVMDNEKKEINAYQVTLDIDVYNDAIDNNEIDILKLNDDLFSVYIDSLTEDFIISLYNEKYENEEMFFI